MLEVAQMRAAGDMQRDILPRQGRGDVQRADFQPVESHPEGGQSHAAAAFAVAGGVNRAARHVDTLRRQGLDGESALQQRQGRPFQFRLFAAEPHTVLVENLEAGELDIRREMPAEPVDLNISRAELVDLAHRDIPPGLAVQRNNKPHHSHHQQKQQDQKAEKDALSASACDQKASPSPR